MALKQTSPFSFLLIFIFSSLANAQIIPTYPIITDPLPSTHVSCPTITRTTSRPLCPTPTTFCATPDCIVLHPITIPCGCPTTVPVATVYTPCLGGCHEGCGTAYETILPSCRTVISTSSSSSSSTRTPTSDPLSHSSSTSTTTTISRTTSTSRTTTSSKSSTLATITTQPSSCLTITRTAGPECVPLEGGCPVPLTGKEVVGSSSSSSSACTVSSRITLECGCISIPTVTSCRTRTCGELGCETAYQTLYLPCPLSLPTPVETVSA